MNVLGWILILALLAVPALIAVNIYKWFRSHSGLSTWRSSVGLAGCMLALASWTLFIIGTFKGWIGGFGSHYVTHLGVSNTGLAVSLVAIVCAFFLNRSSRMLGILSSTITFFLWGGSQLVA